jgi:hypothetical protein
MQQFVMCATFHPYFEICLGLRHKYSVPTIAYKHTLLHNLENGIANWYCIGVSTSPHLVTYSHVM